jgi:glycosyltransferase involved in cell wall biosynthesis
MTVAQWVLAGLVSLGVLYWLLSALLSVRTVRGVPVLECLHPPDPKTWPKLSLVIPACNEADTIEAATKSRLRDDYPDLEIVLIDDRSNDGTGEIIDRLAASDERVNVLHIAELPDRWLGKMHALHRGVRVATGDWLLFSDADVHFEPGTLRHAMAYALHRSLDHLAVIPQFWPASFTLGCMLAMFIRHICFGLRLWAVENPKSSAAVGVGAFNLVRRSAFERTGGFEELRLTIGDDVALGQMLKQSGARCAVANGRHLMGLHFYRSVVEAARATEKAALVMFQFSYLRLVIVLLVLIWLELSPLVALVLGSAVSGANAGLAGPALQVLGAAGTALALFSGLLMNRWLGMPLLPAAFWPIGVVCNAVIVARAGFLAAWRGGHMWRGVLYPNELLRAGNRLRFP